MHASRTILATVAFLATLAGAQPRAVAEEATFSFKDPKGVNAVSFLADSLLEPIVGLASGISGEMSFDPKAPKKTHGKIIIAAATLHTENNGMTETLLSADWLDAEKYPEITFSTKKVTGAKKKRNGVYELKVTGEFTCHGVTKTLKVPVKVTHLPGRLSHRTRGQEGDLLVTRATFTISRKEFGIKPGMGSDVVADEIQVSIAIVGSAPK